MRTRQTGGRDCLEPTNSHSPMAQALGTAHESVDMPSACSIRRRAPSRLGSANRRSFLGRRADSTSRQGAVVYELIVCLPLLIIPLLAVIEYGVLISNEQPLEMAARDAALVASHRSLPDSGPVPPEVIDAVTRVLAEVGIDVPTELANGRMQIRLEHNYDSSTGGELNPSAVLTSGTLDCPPPTFPPPPDPDTTAFGRRYVRVTVCVRSDLLTPNLLNTYCIDISERVTAQTKTYRHTL